MPLSIPPANPPVSLNDAQYPANTKKAAATIDGILTTATSILFQDKIMITITQDGRLAQWIHVPLFTSNANFADQHVPSDENGDSLLPLSQLTPHTLLGGANSDRETVGQLYATQIASAILARDPEEKRTLVLGLGLRKAEASRVGFYDVIDLVQRCL